MKTAQSKPKDLDPLKLSTIQQDLTSCNEIFKAMAIT